MKFRLPFVLVLLNLIALTGASQAKKNKLKVGDQLPETTIQNLLFFEHGTVTKTTELHKGKLLIFDFWGPNCSVCLASMPKLDSLRKKFSDKVEIVLVTDRNRHIIDSFFNKRQALKRLNIPLIINDTILGKTFFPHVTMPHVIWVTEDGKIHAITAGNYITEENIQKVLKGDTFKHITKSDTVNINTDKSLAVDGQKEFIYRSVVTKSLNGNITTIGTTPVNPVYVKEPRFQRILFTKFCVLDLYMAAAYKLKIPTINKYRYVLETYDTIKYVNPSRFTGMYLRSGYQNFDEWAIDYAYNYELTLPTEIDENDFFENMFNDLNRAFDIKGSMEYREVPCYIIVNKSNTKFNTAGGESKFIYIQGKTKSGYFDGIQNKKIEDLVVMLNRFNRGIPIIDESNVKAPVDIPIQVNVSDPNMEELKAELNKVGLDLVKGTRPIKMLVLKDKQ